jgi:hypothetical protein
MNVLVYRPDVSTVDPYGDPVDSDGNVIRQTSPGTYLGTLTGVVLADPTVESLSRGVDTQTAGGNPQSRGDVASVDALVGAPVGASITLQHNDIIITDQGVSYALWGPRTYGRPNVITGQPVMVNGVYYYWLRATALVN